MSTGGLNRKGQSASAALPADASSRAPTGPLSIGEARDVVSYWSLLELFEPADWRAQRSEFVEVERWRVPERTKIADERDSSANDKAASASTAAAEPSECSATSLHSLALALEAPSVSFGRSVLRPPPGERAERSLPFFTVYIGILPKAKLYRHMLALLDAAEIGYLPTKRTVDSAAWPAKAVFSAFAPDGAERVNKAPFLSASVPSLPSARQASRIGEDPSLRGDAFLAAFHLSPWGKIVPESFTVSGYVGALNLARRRLQLLQRLEREGRREAAAALRREPVFTVESALLRCGKLVHAFNEHATKVCGIASRLNGDLVKRVFDRDSFTLSLSDPQTEAKRVEPNFIEHIARGVAGFMGYDGPIDAAIRTVFHRPDHPFGPEDLVDLQSFYLSDLASIGVALKESGVSPCQSPLGDRLATLERERALGEASAPLHKDSSRDALKEAEREANHGDALKRKKIKPARSAPISAPLSRLLLHGIDEGIARTDLLKSPAALSVLLDPSRLPSGRWPSEASHHLYVAQQAALSVILSLGERDGFGAIASVNGPPGTGKSWMLRDVVAEIVVRRARKMAAFSTSKAVFDFDHPLEFEIGNKTHEVMPLKTEIGADSVIVVASNNNAAIRNITDELPRSFSLARIAQAANIARQCAKSGEDVGNTNNDGKEKGLKSPALTAFEADPVAFAPQAGPTGKRFVYWRSCARALFLASQPKKRLSDNAPSLFGTAPDLSVDDIWGLISVTLGRKANRLRFVRAVLEPRLKDRASGDVRRESELAAAIREGLVALKRAGLEPEAYWRMARDRFLALDRRVAERRDALAAKYAKFVSNAGKERTGEKKTEKTGHGPAVFETPLEAAPAQHKTSLWVDEDFETLRSTLFLSALALTQATLLAQSKIFLSSFEAIAAYLKSGEPALTKGRPEAIWAVLSLLVPVVSTTLASASRMFSQLGPSTIGWVLLDEASQATPQAAAGLLNRAKRAVILGDPRQLMPVVTMPNDLCDYLRLRVSGVDARWSPHVSSLQILADNTMPLGTNIRDAVTEALVWTGLPLRTHRRCASPMFDIANALSYANQMVQMTPRVDAAQALPSLWLDVQTEARSAEERKEAFRQRGLRVERHAPDAKIVPEEMSVLRETLLLLLRRRAMQGGRIFVVSPFRSVADLAARVIEDVRRSQVTPTLMRADTVHAFQGQEADVVVFVLGSAAGEMGVRQRRWAANPTNLLNVAVTRARRGIIVIGNREAWMKEKSFGILADHLRAKDAAELAFGPILTNRR